MIYKFDLDRRIDDIIVLIAGPGAGKGTISKPIEKFFGHFPISSGDTIKEFAKPTHELYTIFKTESGPLRNVHRAALACMKYAKEGNLAPTHLVRQIIDAKIQLEGYPNKIILDGFPRKPDQAEQLSELLEGRKYQIRYMNVNQENLILRQGYRRDGILKELMEPRHYAIFKQLKTEEQKIDYAHEIFQTDLENLGIRNTDLTLESRTHRANVFELETVPAVNYFEGQSNYAEFDGNGTKKEALRNFLETFELPTNYPTYKLEDIVLV